MTRADHWQAVERLYHEAAERPRAERGSFLASACGGDEALRKEVESLLASDEEGMLDEPAFDLAAREIVARQRDAGAGYDPSSLVGRRLGGYEVLSLLGAGGMGEVYLARDTTLGREVALKVLPRELSSDPERLNRLEREARVLASLNHPAIATLYGLEEAEGQRVLVMERVPGPTLAERLRRGPLPLREALVVARQMAEALEAAHEAGVVHRDLKPANVKVTPEGRAKLLDFGLAKALLGSGGDLGPAPAEGATREGTVVGTPAYMSPEQARGQPVDRRTDIWAFGCCLYESLVGQRTFGGDSMSDTLAAVLDREPDWTSLPEATPEGVRKLLRRCLTKDVRQRLQHIGDARLELGEVDVGLTPRTKPDPLVGVPKLSGVLRILVAGAVLGALATGIGSWLAWRASSARQGATPPASPVTRFTLRLDDEAVRDHRLPVAARSIPFALSPDGARLVIFARGTSGTQLLMRELSGFATKALPGTEGASDPFFSPDGRWVGFWSAKDHKLWKVSTAGGPPIEIAPTEVPYRVLWSEDDEILLNTGTEFWSIPTAGGQPREIPIQDVSKENWISLQGRIPGRSDLLVASVRGGETWFEVLSRQTGKRRRLLRGARVTLARLTPTGHLVYASGDTLFAVPMDRERLEPLGSPVPVIQGIDHGFRRSSVAVSDMGTVVYVPAERVRKAEFAWLDRTGKATPVPYGDFEPFALSVSPDGRHAAVGLLEGATPGVWVLDLERRSRTLLASGAMQPIYSRDGAFVTYLSSYGAEFVFSRKRADGSGEEEHLFTHHSSGWSEPRDWSPDGRSLLFTSYSPRGDADVWIHSGDQTSPLLASPFDEWSATFSPDGRFIAYDADEGGDTNVYLQPFPGQGPRTPASIGGGRRPRWRRDGRLFFLGDSGRRTKMMVVDVETEPELRVGRPRELFETDRRWRGYDVTADGRFLARRPREPMDGPIELKVIVNWFEELERLAPHPSRWR